MNAVETAVAPILATDQVRVSQRRGRLTPEEVKDIFLSTDSTNKCGARYRVTGATISMIRTRKIWAHITKDLVRPQLATAG